MTSIGSPSPFFLAGKKAYEVERSLRFSYGDSANLTRTSSSASTTFTYSAWIKRSRISEYQSIFSMGVQAFTFHANYHTLILYDGSTLHQSTAVFRDPSAWYHIVVQINSGVATSYVNNVLVHNAVGSGFTLTTGTNETRVGSQVNTYYFNGYQAEINFVDGSVLAPSSFAETDADTGQWNPKKYIGSYGTNGFYLTFSDNSDTSATTLGKDTSGNSNNFTPNNFSVSAGAGNDSLEDTPTNNFCTLNPLSTVHTENIQSMLTNGNLDYTPSGDYSIVKATIPFPSSGKWYVEAKINSATGGSAGIGVQRLPATSYNTNSYLSYQCNDYCYSYQGGGIIAKGSSSSTTVASSLEAFAANDILAILFDADNNEIKWYNNNTLIYTLDLSSAPDGFYINDGEWVFAFMAYSGDGTINVNFGQRPFNYTQPTGSKALNSSNLPDPTIKLPNKHFDTLIYTGNGSSPRTISGLQFSPDFVWLKHRNSTSWHRLQNSVVGANKLLYSNSTNAEATDESNGHLNSFTSDGFIIDDPNADGLNNNGGTYVGWNWNAGGSTVTNNDGSVTSQVMANTTAGFSVVSFTSDGTSLTVGHGLGVPPDVIIKKQRNASSDWYVFHKSIGATQTIKLNENSGKSASSDFANTSPTSTVFSSYTTGVSGRQIIAYCFSEVAGYSKFGSYTGNGSTDGTFVFTGFRVSWLMVKRIDTTNDWPISDNKRSHFNIVDKALYADLNNSENTTNRYDFLSNGFKIRNNLNESNASGGTYIYLCFAESPFKNARAR